MLSIKNHTVWPFIRIDVKPNKNKQTNHKIRFVKNSNEWSQHNSWLKSLEFVKKCFISLGKGRVTTSTETVWGLGVKLLYLLHKCEGVTLVLHQSLETVVKLWVSYCEYSQTTL